MTQLRSRTIHRASPESFLSRLAPRTGPRHNAALSLGRTAMRLYTLLVAFLVSLLTLPSAGCISDTLRDELTTEISINNPGGAQSPFEIQKRFKFTHNPAEAVSVNLESAYINIILPSDARLSFASRAQFFTEYKGQRVLIAEASGFGTDTTYADLNIVYKEDLHPFLSEDGLMDLIIRVEPNGWYPARHDLILISTVATISFDL